MAERRMFAKTIIDSDMFLDMPLPTQALYFHLAMRADDEGFVNNPKKILRMIAADEDSLKLLIAKRFIIPFESGIVVIKHWRIHNYIQKDRFKGTNYEEEKSQLTTNKNGEYELLENVSDTPCIQDGYKADTQVRLAKYRLGEDRLGESDMCTADKPQTAPADVPKTKRFIKPTLEEVQAYCTERRNSIDVQHFIDYYESNGWKVGKNAMKDWKAAVRTWERNGYGNGYGNGGNKNAGNDTDSTDRVYDEHGGYWEDGHYFY